MKKIRILLMALLTLALCSSCTERISYDPKKDAKSAIDLMRRGDSQYIDEIATAYMAKFGRLEGKKKLDELNEALCEELEKQGNE